MSMAMVPTGPQEEVMERLDDLAEDIARNAAELKALVQRMKETEDARRQSSPDGQA